MGGTARQLGDLISIGPAMLRDFELLGIRSVAQLARQNPQRMYARLNRLSGQQQDPCVLDTFRARLNRLSGQQQDPCVLDTFRAAVAQARNPRLPAEQCQWWWWSKERKTGKK